MSDWTSGYVADVGYTYGYCADLNPLRVRLAFLNAGLVPPEVGAACELGFGQGMSTNLHAAASVVQWQGTDFNPSHAAFAQELAQASGSGAGLYDEAFAQFCQRPDLPDFDFIGLHGIWSWISDDNRAVIVDFVRRKLKVGGVLYISYNTQPGWAAMVPMRDLLLEHAKVMGSEGAGILGRVEGSLAFAKQLLAVNPAFAEANPQITQRIEGIQAHNLHYVAHEYFNRDWQPMSFAKMAMWLEDAKLQWGCSASYGDVVNTIKMTPQQRELLAAIPDAMFRESVRDFCVNQQFRKDYWVKGARKMSEFDRAEAIRAQRVVLVKPRAEVELYETIVDLLADHQIRSLGELEAMLAQGNEEARKVNWQVLVQAIMILCSSGAVHVVQSDEAIAQALPKAHKLNAHLLRRARGATEVNDLASPVTGGGVAVNRFEQLFLQAHQEGGKKPKDWASYTFNILLKHGQGVVRNGQLLTTAQDAIAELTKDAEAFSKRRLPILQALRVV